MQETDDSTISSFGGSLMRKSSQKTYGRRGRAYLAAKEAHERATHNAENSQQQLLEANQDGGTRGRDSKTTLHSSVSTSMPGGRRASTIDIERRQTLNKKRTRVEVDVQVRTPPKPEHPVMNTGPKRQRVSSSEISDPLPLSGSAQTLPPEAITPSSDLTELPSETEDTDAERTPKAVRQRTPPDHIHDELQVKKQQESPSTHRTTVKQGRVKQSVPITPPSSTTFLPAIISTADSANNTQPVKFPLRKKARMLSRAESFGRKEAQKDQQEPVSIGTENNSDVTTSTEQKPSDIAVGSSMSLAPATHTAPSTPRRSLVRSSTLASLDASPSKQRGPLARTTSMPLSPAKTSIIVPAPMVEPERVFSAASVVIPSRKTYGKVRGSNLQANETISNPPAVGGGARATLSPIPQSSAADSDTAPISPSRPDMEQRESYADLVKRLEMDDEEESQDRDELDGSMDYLRNAQSLAELRSKGENRKFMDDLTWLLDGLNDDVLSVRRSSAIDVLNKMSDSGWFEKLRICSQVEEIYVRLAAGRQKSTDTGYDLAFLEYLSYIARASKAIPAILGNHRDDILTFALHVLRSPSLAFNITATNIKRKTSPVLKAVSTLRVSLNLTDADGTPLSALAMAMMIISVVTGHCISGHIETPDIAMQEQVCTAIVDALQQCLKILPERMELFEKGLDLFPDGTPVDFAFLADAVEALSEISSAWPVVRARLETVRSGLATDLGNLLLVMQFVEIPLLSGKADLACRLLVTPTLSSKCWSLAILESAAPAGLAFRLLVASGCLSEVTDTQDSERKNVAQTDHGVDNIGHDHNKEISMPLGLLYNLMDVAGDSGESLLLQTELSVHCSRKPLCLRQCRCSDRKTGISLLCDVFNRQQDRRIDDPSAAFLAGYLTLLFTKVLERRSCREAILESIQGVSQDEKLLALQDCLRQFADVYESAQTRLEQMLPNNEDESAPRMYEEEAIARTIKTGLGILQSISPT